MQKLYIVVAVGVALIVLEAGWQNVVSVFADTLPEILLFILALWVLLTFGLQK